MFHLCTANLKSFIRALHSNYFSCDQNKIEYLACTQTEPHDIVLWSRLPCMGAMHTSQAFSGWPSWSDIIHNLTSNFRPGSLLLSSWSGHSRAAREQMVVPMRPPSQCFCRLHDCIVARGLYLSISKPFDGKRGSIPSMRYYNYRSNKILHLHGHMSQVWRCLVQPSLVYCRSLMRAFGESWIARLIAELYS